jgi:hypothetical protein
MLGVFNGKGPFGEAQKRFKRPRKPRPSFRYSSLFDDLVGAGKDRLRHGKTECLRGFHVDHQLEAGRLIYRQIGRLGTVEDLSDINAELSIENRAARPIAQQAAGFGEFAGIIDRWNGMA